MAKRKLTILKKKEEIKVKKIIVLFIMLILSVALFGCNNEEKVKIEFKMKNICKVVEVNKGSVITDDIIPFDDKNIELYYDITKNEKYNGEHINSNITIYAFKNVILNMETEKYIKQCVIDYHKSKNELYSKTIDDVIIKRYYGNFNGVQIAVIEGDVENVLTVVGPPFYICYVEGNGYLIKYFPEIISAYYENKYYTLSDACMEGLITKEILDQLDCYY